MNKIIKIFALLVVLTAFMAIGCAPDNNPNSSGFTGDSVHSSVETVEEITVKSTDSSVSLKDAEVLNHDFKQYFVITHNGKNVEVKDEYIDLSGLSEQVGSFTITCSYGDKQAEITVTVIATLYEVILSTEEIRINKSLALSYDYLSLFTATIDGNAISITSDMIVSNVKAEVGEYQVTVTNGNVSKTLKVIVTNEHDILAVATYPKFEINQDLIATYDFTNLFSLYVDGEFVAVTQEMLDISALENATVGNSYQIVLNYALGDSQVTKHATVKVINSIQTVINAKNVVTYPNSEYIDLTTLFEIIKGDQVIPVTGDMITGSVDYSKVGVNQIVLNYQGETVTATVEIKLGVIIGYAKGETVTVRVGTDKETYAFSNDFTLCINGIEFIGFERYIDTSNVNFNQEGLYTATLTIPYNDKAFGLSGVRFDNISADITYAVVPNEYSVTVLNNTVELSKGSTSYDVYKNIKLTINGRNQSFTDNKDWVDVMTCYYEIISAPIDFSSKAVQEVVLALYVNGVNFDPVIVRYNLVINSNVTITTNDQVVYTGATVYTTDLFTITEDGNVVNITYDMISGKVDTLKPGMYSVSVNYQGVTAQANVVVLDNGIKGNYSTMLHTIAETSSDYDEEYGDTVSPTRRLGDLIINDQGGIRVLGADCTVLGVVNESTLRLKVKSYEYDMYYSNGIIVLNPENAIKLPYNPEKRPLIYFHKNDWTLEERVVINQYSTYVLNATSVCYSIDAFKIKNNKTGESLWYALKVNMVEKISSDTVYTIEWGEITFNEDFTMQAEAVNYYTFNGVTQRFIMTDRTQGQVKALAEEKLFANKKFEGNINGKIAQLIVDQYEGFSVVIDGKTAVKVGSYQIEQMANGYVDHKNNEVFIYGVEDQVFAYKFQLNLEDNTFTIAEQDGFFGKYVYDNVYLFLDGYGTGIVNFNTKSYYKYQFAYSIVGNKIELTYLNTKPSFEHGKNATLFMDAFNNVLIGSYFYDERLIGKRFENTTITDGVIVTIDSYQVGADSDTVAKANLLSNIHIRTANGELNNTEKAKYVKTNFVRFNTPGFYKFTISATVKGETVEVPYTVQVLSAIYEGNPIVATYGEGVIFNVNSLMINKYGQAVVVADGVTFNGSAVIFADNTFVINATNGAKTIKVNGNMIENGLIFVRCTGYATFSDYFTTGSHEVVGEKGYILRIITIANKQVYVRSLATTAVGNIVSAEVVSGTAFVNGCILKITEEKQETFVKILEMGNVNKGLQLADAYRGEFTDEQNAKTFNFDGFGKVISNEVVGSYKLVDNVATVYLGNSVAVYRLNSTTRVAVKENISLDNSLIQGNAYSATYNFYANSTLYSATTNFVFGENGVVTAISTSSEYSQESYGKYEPPFASETGVNGTYYVNGDIVNISINGHVFTLRINFLLRPDSLTVESTTLSDEDHGYFTKGTIFTK